MKLSPHLDLAEIERSDLATYFGWDNRLPEQMIPTWKRMANEIFEPVREALGQPIFVTSGYRCPDLQRWLWINRGASTNSQHQGIWLKGVRDYLCAALDLWVVEEKRFELWQWCTGKLSGYEELLPFDQAIYEFGTDEVPAWVHVSYVEGIEPRREILRSYHNERGKVEYKPCQ